jgi:plasmid stabilization system protein ParE
LAKKRWLLEFTTTADRDLHALHDFIRQERPAAASRWLREVKRKVELLKTTPLAFEAIPETPELALPLRHILHGNYRIIYLVGEDRVSIIRIIHAARLLTHGLLGLEPPESAE